MLAQSAAHCAVYPRRLRTVETLERLRSCAELDHGRSDLRAWRSILGVADKELRAIYQLRADLSPRTQERLAEYFGLDPASIEEGRIDFREAAVRQCRHSELPETYRVAAFGRRRATISSLDYLERRSGWRVRRRVFSKFGVNEAMFSNPMDPISMRFMTDVASHLTRQYGYRREDLYAMGTQLYESGRSTLIAKVFSNCSGPSELYERFFGDMMKHFEQNCHYDIIRMDDDHCVFEVRSRGEVAEALGVKHLGNRELCAVKAGFISSMKAYVDQTFSAIQEHSCVHRGDATCRFELRFREPGGLRLLSSSG